MVHLVCGSYCELFLCNIDIELADETFSTYKRLGPTYLNDSFSQAFFEINNLWSSKMSDKDLVHMVETIEKYNPLVEDISLNNATLYGAVEKIELDIK